MNFKLRINSIKKFRIWTKIIQKSNYNWKSIENEKKFEIQINKMEILIIDLNG